MAKLNIQIELNGLLINNVRIMTDALERIIALHGSRNEARHECGEMVRIASSALDLCQNNLSDFTGEGE